jgi:endonuclease-3 related protein
MLDEEFGGSLDLLAARPSDTLRPRLLSLPSVGPETADAILLYALGHPVPVADEYLRRIAERHRLLAPPPRHDRKGYDSMATLTRLTFAADNIQNQAWLFNEFHALTVAVGKAHCGRTAHCEGCPLAADLEVAHSSKTREDVSWNQCTQVDATNSERRPFAKRVRL